MRITGARIFSFQIPFVKPFSTASGIATSREGLIIELQSGALVGLGEASLLPQASAGLDLVSEAACRLCREALRIDAWDLVESNASVGNPAERAARAGLEISAWDLLARHESRPLAALFNPNYSRTVAVNALISDRDAAGAAAGGGAARAAGYETVKLKVAMEASVAAELERIARVREALGSGVCLRLDANGAWDFDVACETLRAVAEFDIEYVEQPLPPGNLPLMQALSLAVSVPIALDEEVTSIEAAEQILAARAAQVLILKPLQLGGLGPALAIAANAAAAGVRSTVTTTIDSGIGTAAAIHLASALADDGVHGLATAELLEASLTTPLPIQRGRMYIPDGLGLGVDLESAAVRYLTQIEALG